MKILCVAPDRGMRFGRHGGHATGLLRVVSAYVRLGHDVRVLAPSVPDGFRTPAPFVALRDAAVLELLDVEAGRVEDAKDRERAEAMVAALRHVFANVDLEQVLEREIREFRPDLLHDLHAPYNATGIAVAARERLPHVLHVHASLAWEEEQFRKPPLARALRLFEAATMRHAPRIVAVSEELKRFLIDDGAPAERVRVVENGVDLDMFHPAVPDRPERRDAFVIGFFGSLKEWHGVEVLLAAFEMLAADPRFRLEVVGAGPLKKKVVAFATRYPGRVEVIGGLPLAETAERVRAMDVTVAPYLPIDRFYFSPLKVLESMACGRPTVASALGVLPRWIENGVNGVLFPAGDARALAAAIRRLADDPPLRARIGAEAAVRARAKHSILDRAREIIEWGMAGAGR